MSLRAVALVLVSCALISSVTAFNNMTVGDIQIHTLPGTVPRYFLTYYPNSLANATGPAPVAFVLHQLGQSCFELMTSDTAAHLTQSAEQQQVVVVAPCGLTSKMGVAWNAGVCCGWNGDESPPDDVAFLENVLSITSQLTTIDFNRVAAVGMGNGGFMAQILGCLLPTKFRLIATVAGMVTLTPGDDVAQTLCSEALALQTVRPTILTVQGDQDGVVGWSGSPVVHLLTPIENFVAWANRNGCETNNANYPLNQWDDATFESRKYTVGCMQNATVELVRWWGGGHVWPTGATDGFDATNYFFTNLLRM